MDTAVCKECAQEKTKIRSERYPNGKYVYRDERGKRWNRRQCPKCVLVLSKKNYKRRNTLTDWKNKKGIAAEKQAAGHFILLGYDVLPVDCHGPDLVLTRGQERLTCEVKSVTKYDVNGKDFYFVSPVYRGRRVDDLMAMVFDDGFILVQPMKEHLAECSKTGRRNLTRFVRERSGESYRRLTRKPLQLRV